MFPWNKALAGGAISTVTDWFGGGVAQGLAWCADQVHYPMPTTVQTAVQILASAVIVAGVVYFVPNAKPPAAPAESSEHA
jgi:hypothetical protein